MFNYDMPSNDEIRNIFKTVHPHLIALCNAIENLAIADSIEEFNTWVDIAQIETDTIDHLMNLNSFDRVPVIDKIKSQLGDFASVYPNAVKLGVI